MKIEYWLPQGCINKVLKGHREGRYLSSLLFPDKTHLHPSPGLLSVLQNPSFPFSLKSSILIKPSPYCNSLNKIISLSCAFCLPQSISFCFDFNPRKGSEDFCSHMKKGIMPATASDDKTHLSPVILASPNIPSDQMWQSVSRWTC